MQPAQLDRRPLTTADWAILVLAMVLPTAVTWLYFIALAQAPAAVQQTAYAAGKAVQFGLPACWVWLVQREKLSFPRPVGNGLVAGAAFGMAVALLMAGLYLAVLKPMGLLVGPAAAVREKVQSFGAGSPAAFLFMAIFYSAVHSLLEEYYWRWFVFRQLSRGIQVPLAIGVSSLAFAAHHVLVLAKYFGWASAMTWLFVLGVTIGGAVWAWLYQRSGSLYASWLSHALVDAAIFAIGYDLIA